MPPETSALDTQRHGAALRWGFRLFLGIQLIPFIVLFTLRYELDGYYVAPTVNQWLGVAENILMLASLVTVWQGLTAIRENDRETMQRRLKWTSALGALYLALLIYDWSQRVVPVGTRFGGMFYTTIGVSAFYTAAGLFVLVATVVRTGRVVTDAQNHWDVEAAAWYWVFQGAIAVLMNLYLHWI
ncbi:MAG: cytochrome c oxidase subunit 3 [Firmicutes bacterium]|nr:cytochrome c oxidase subunit 3 [Bacillota bacterium]